MSTVKIEKWKHVCASKEKKDKVTHTFPFFLWLIHWHICCSFSISSQILRTTKRLSRLILSILCSYFFFYSAESTLTTSKKKRRFSCCVKRESMQIIPLNSFIIYADFFSLSRYIFFIVHVNVSKMVNTNGICRKSGR